MRVLSAFRDVKTRLLALVAFIIFPAVLVTILLAAAADQSLSSGIDRQWRQTTDEYAIRARLWAKGAVRTFFAFAASTISAREDEQRCNAMLHDVIAVNNGYKAIRVDFNDGRFCVGAEDPEYMSFAGEISAKLRSTPRAELAPGMPLAAGVFQARGRNVLAIQVDGPASTQQKWTATALIDPILLAWAFELNPDGRDIVALMERGQKIVAATGRSSHCDRKPA